MEDKHICKCKKEGLPCCTDNPKEEGFGRAKQLPKMYKIAKIQQESKDSTTFFFKGKINFKPGQFVMLWLPGIDEKPFTVSYLEKDSFGITIQRKGIFTDATNNLSKGDLLGIRGPYGTSFSLKNNSIIIAGGLGIVPLRTLILELKKKKYNFKIIQGAGCKDSLLFREELKKLSPKSELCTDDGSLGMKCFTTDLLDSYLKKHKPSFVYSVGPEIMMKKILDICIKHKIDCELSLERYMKCGFGICGQCACSDKLVCLDGPVFSRQDLMKMTEFGNTAYLKDGTKVSMKEYASWRQKS